MCARLGCAVLPMAFCPFSQCGRHRRIRTARRLRRDLWREGQRHHEPCAVPKETLDVDLPVMTADNLPANRQPQACAARQSLSPT
jgi:hypothetical protein